MNDEIDVTNLCSTDENLDHLRVRDECDPVATRWVVLSLIAIWCAAIAAIAWVWWGK